MKSKELAEKWAEEYFNSEEGKKEEFNNAWIDYQNYK